MKGGLFYCELRPANLRWICGSDAREALTADYLISSERQLRLLAAGERMTRGDKDPC